MPYIAASHRESLDPHIDRLAEAIVAECKVAEHDAAFAGLLNYASTRLALRVLRLRFDQMRYWMIASVVGVFHNVADEFYRRVGVPYEDKQIAINGDVDAYIDYANETGG